MKTLFLAAALTTTLANPSATAAERSPVAVKIDPKTTRGTWEGWGTSLCWMGNVFGDRDDMADFLFTNKTVTFNGTKVPGLGMNIVRYNAGACAWKKVEKREMIVSKIIKEYRQMEGFWIDGKDPDPASKSWDWSVDAKQRAMLQKAKERGANHFELFSNSPMWWMCANDNPSGGAKPTDDNLSKKHYQDFAVYLAAIAKYSKENWGVSFTTVSPFNEPMSTWWFADCKQEGCHFSHSAQAKFLPLMRAELDRQGLRDLPLAASDETHYDHAVATWRSLGPQLKAIIPQVNVHGYQYDKGDRAGLHRAVVKEDGKKLWNSEYGEGDSSGLEMARNFHLDMDQLRPTAWAYWQPTDGGGWGMLDCNMEKAVVKKVNPKAFVFAQYSRHILPGMVIMDSGDERTVAAYSAAERKLVLAVFNDGPERTATYDLKALAVVDGVVRSVLTEPKGSARYKWQPDIKIAGGRFETRLAADSIQTFLVTGVDGIIP